jgi:hypothetical protein
MYQDVIVLVIVGLTIGWIVFKTVRSLVAPKKQGGCAGCSGCELSSRNKGCNDTSKQVFTYKHLTVNKM